MPEVWWPVRSAGGWALNRVLLAGRKASVGLDFSKEDARFVLVVKAVWKRLSFGIKFCQGPIQFSNTDL